LKLNSKQKQYLILGVVIVLLLGFSSSFIPLEVLSVDRIWLETRGVEGTDGELQDGIWRITATSQDSKVQLLTINQYNIESFGEFPTDLEVNGDIYVEVSQPYNPYWVIPVTDLGVVEVVPSMQGVKVGTAGFTGDTKADAVKVQLWGLNLAAKKVVIPFEITAAKLLGENVGILKTDDPRAKLIAGDYPKYSLSISQSDIVAGEASRIVFYNPNDANEKLTINLLWSFGDYDRYSWNENLLFITPESGGTNLFPTTDMTFLAANEPAIRTQLNWQSGNDWTFSRYWYGGGNAFKGTAVSDPLLGDNNIYTGNIIELNSKSTAKISPYGEPLAYILTEGFANPASLSFNEGPELTGIYEYPGWFTPRFGAVELSGDSPSDWLYWRYPLTPNIGSNTDSSPDGLSVRNYLSSSVSAPVTGYTHSAFPRRNPDVWGYGVGGNIGVGGQIAVVLPPTARQWLFTLDISTQLADTVVVREDYVNVQISQPLSFDRYTLNAGETAYGTVKLRNLSNWSGRASVSITPPDNLQYSVQISGGGSYDFAIGEEKIVNFQIKNTGLLDEQKSGTFRLSVKNQQPYETASSTFSMTFKPGIGTPDTQLDVTTKDADTGTKIGGITIKAVYGVNGESSRIGSTTDGECVLNLGKYEGPVTISAIDYQGRYESAEQVVQVQPGSNPVTFNLIKVGSSPDPDFPYWLVSAVLIGSMGLVVVYLWRRKH